MNRDNVEAVKEIFAEGALFDGALQRFVGGGKDAHVNRDVPLAAEAGKFAVLQYVQELRLQRGMHLADLIEEDGAVIGLLELAELLAVGAGERTRLVAEELTFEKLTWYRGAIHFDEWLVAAGGVSIHHARDDFFTGTTFTADKHDDIGISHLLHRHLHFFHLRTGAEEHGEIALTTYLVAQLRNFVNLALALENTRHALVEIFGFERLADVIVGTELGGLEDEVCFLLRA